MFVHGTRTSSAIWDPQVAALRAAGHTVHALDLPGHGTRAGERFTFAGAIAAIDAAVSAQPGRPMLVGLSLGGYASLAYAARHHGRLSGVMLSGCSTEIAGKPLHLYRRVTSRIAAALRPDGSWHVVADMLHALHGYSALADLRRLPVPVWIVNGVRDPLRLEERRMVKARPDARLHVVRRAGHDVNSDAPQDFLDILRGALAHLHLSSTPALAHP